MKQTKSQQKASKRRYYITHKAEHAEWSKAYYIEHKDEYKARAQQYYQENKDALKAKHKEYYEVQKTKKHNKKQSTLVGLIDAITVIDEKSSSHSCISVEQISNIEDMLLEALDVMSYKTKYRDLCVELMQKAETIFESYRSDDKNK